MIRIPRCLPFALALSSFAPAPVGGPVATPSVEFTLVAQTVPEDVQTVAATLTLSEPSGQDVEVPFTVAGTAQLPADYTIDSSPVTIPAGETVADIEIFVVNDARVEGPETIEITLGDPTNATLGTTTVHTVTVRDDERRPAGVGATPMRLRVEPTSLTFPVTRMGETGAPTTLTVTNDDPSPVTFDGFDALGEDPSHFTIEYASPPPLLLLPGESTNVDVRFAPLEKGPREAFLRARQTPQGAPPALVPVAGTGIGPTHGEVLLNSGPGDHLDGAGELWTADYGVVGASWWIDTDQPIEGTTEDPLYQTARAGADFAYALDLPAGTYAVTLHFAEILATGPGQRVFDVAVEGEVVLDDLDLFFTAGNHVAFAHTVNAYVDDGTLDVALSGEVGPALVAAVEVRSIPVVFSSVVVLDFGTIDEGETAEIPFALMNVGLHEGLATTLSFIIASEDHAAGHDFWVDVNGTRYHGDHDTVSHTIDLVLPPGTDTDLTAGFEPTEHAESELRLRFEGNFQPLEIVVRGIGSSDDWGFLHPVIEHDPPLLVDYDGDGQEAATLDAFGSHTHEPGHTLAAFEWREDGVVFSTKPRTVRSFPVGGTDIDLTIYDDHDPPESATEHAAIPVHEADSVPGVLARYYQAAAGEAVALLDAVPAEPDFTERRAELGVTAGSTVGGSTLTSDVMVRLQGDFEVSVDGSYDFVAIGGVEHRLEVDGVPFGGAQVLEPGEHSLEARFAVDTLFDLPVSVAVTIDGSPAEDFAAGITHDEIGIVPRIHTMPSTGNESGGNRIAIVGFGYYPATLVLLHWGDEVDSPTFDLLDFASFHTERIELDVPPSPGPAGEPYSIQVTVETPAGVSNAWVYTYEPDGEVPIVFEERPDVPADEATTGVWGPDGRLYVGSLEGEIHAFTFDEDYFVLASETFPGVSGLDQHELLGIALDPFDPPDPVRLYVTHSDLYAQGGGSFEGPAPYPGRVSVLTGPDFDDPVPVITGLPTSNLDHSVNGLVFDHNGDLLVCVGGNTNAGVKHPNAGDLPASPLSGAIVKAEVSRPDFDGAVTYVESDTGTPNDDQVDGEIVDVAPGKHVAVHAPGMRNPYDLELTTWRTLYATDNGPNSYLGVASLDCDQQGDFPGPHSYWDELNLVEYGNYYGHANRSRGRTDPRQCVFRDQVEPPLPEVFTPAIGQPPSSSDGLAEYRAGSFGGQMRGELLVQEYQGPLHRVKLSADRRRVDEIIEFHPETVALDVVVAPGGAIIGMDYYENELEIRVPDDAAAVGLTVIDVFPWRAPSTGGAPFVIGGHGFGTLSDTSVTFNGVSATLSTVTPRRIHGILPAGMGAELELVDVAVQVGTEIEVLAEAFLPLPPARGMATGHWVAAAQLPEPLGAVAGGAIDGILYLVGESPGGDEKTWAYDILNDVWTDNLAQRPYAGRHHAAEVVDGKLILIGGLDAGMGKVQVFDPKNGAQGTWTSGTDLPWEGGAVSTAVVEGKVYAAGGIVDAATVDTAAVYDPALDDWSLVAPMPTGVNRAAAGSDGSRMFVFGGRQGGDFPQEGFDTVQIYSPATNTWDSSDEVGSTLAPMPSGRGGAARAVHDRGQFYVFGGETPDSGDPEADPGGVFPQVFVYDPAGNDWRTEARMPTARHGAYPVLFQSRVFVAGGGEQVGSSTSSVHEVFTRQ